MTEKNSGEVLNPGCKPHGGVKEIVHRYQAVCKDGHVFEGDGEEHWDWPW